MVDSTDGVKLRTRLFKPSEGHGSPTMAIVLVHPYSVLGGSQGLLKGIASGLAENGYVAVTFDMRGVGRSTGGASLTGFSEVNTSFPSLIGSPTTSLSARSSWLVLPPVLLLLALLLIR